MNKGGFSWKRLTGVSRAKSKISRATGIPLTKSGRQRKVGKIVTGGGCLMVMVSFGISCLGLVLLSMVSGGLLHAAGVEKKESPATPATVRAAAVQCAYEKNWFANVFPRKAVIPHGFHVVSANWSGRTENESWPGRGHSCIIRNDGTVLRMSESVTGDDIIIADLPIGRRKTADSK